MQYSARSQFSLGAKLAEIRKDGAEEIYGNGERLSRRWNDHFVVTRRRESSRTCVPAMPLRQRICWKIDIIKTFTDGLSLKMFDVQRGPNSE